MELVGRNTKLRLNLYDVTWVVSYNTGITYDKVLVITTGTNSIQVAWLISDAVSVPVRYSISCSTLDAMKKNKPSDLYYVTPFNNSFIKSKTVNDLVPYTTYNCCIAEYHGVNNNISVVVCKMTTTLSERQEPQRNSSSFSSTLSAAIALSVMLFIALLCTSILIAIIMKQSNDGTKIQKWWVGQSLYS